FVSIRRSRGSTNFPYTTLVRSAAEIDPRDPDFVAVDATWYFQERRFEEAKERFELATRLDGTRLETYIGTIQSHIALGEVAEAADRKSTRLNSSHVKSSYAGLC